MENIVRILLKQFLCQSDSIPQSVENAYDEWSSRRKVPDEAIFSGQLIASLAKLPSAFVMLDALDECSEETLQKVISLIHQIKHSGVNVFCTSRTHLISLEKELDNPTMIRIEAQDDDVRKYLTKRLSEEKRFSRIRGQILERLTDNIERT
jgi:hypothetical protein